MRRTERPAAGARTGTTVTRVAAIHEHVVPRPREDVGAGRQFARVVGRCEDARTASGPARASPSGPPRAASGTARPWSVIRARTPAGGSSSAAERWWDPPFERPAASGGSATVTASRIRRMGRARAAPRIASRPPPASSASADLCLGEDDGEAPDYADTMSEMRMGRDVRRLPVAWWMAFPMAAAVPTMPSSPMPLTPSGFT